MKPNYGLWSAAGSFLELLSNGNGCFKNYFTVERLQVEGYKLGSAIDVFYYHLQLGAVIFVNFR